MFTRLLRVKLSRDELANLQFVRLKHVLKHAYQYSRFYRDHYKSFGFHPDDFKSIEDLRKIPVVQRAQIKLAASEQFIANPRGHVLKLHTTSGSSGIPVKIFHTKAESRKILWSCLRSYFEAGQRLTDRTVALRDPIDVKTLNWHQKIGILKYDYFNVFDPLQDIYGRICQRYDSIDILKGYPTDLFSLLSLAQKSSSKAARKFPVIKCIYTDSEVLDDRVRDYLIATAKCKLLDFYAAVECGMIAFQNEALGEYWVNEDMVLLEPFKKIQDEGSDGKDLYEVAVTNLYVNTSPIIRYEIGDVVEFATMPTALQRFERLSVRRIHGKYLDFIVRPNGSILSPHVPKQELTHLVGLKKFQVVQERIDFIRVNIDKDEGFTLATEDEIRSRLSRAFGADIEFDLFDVPGLGRGSSRKFRVVESKIAQEHLERAMNRTD